MHHGKHLSPEGIVRTFTHEEPSSFETLGSQFSLLELCQIGSLCRPRGRTTAAPPPPGSQTKSSSSFWIRSDPNSEFSGTKSPDPDPQEPQTCLLGGSLAQWMYDYSKAIRILSQTGLIPCFLYFSLLTQKVYEHTFWLIPLFYMIDFISWNCTLPQIDNSSLVKCVSCTTEMAVYYGGQEPPNSGPPVHPWLLREDAVDQARSFFFDECIYTVFQTGNIYPFMTCVTITLLLPVNHRLILISLQGFSEDKRVMLKIRSKSLTEYSWKFNRKCL